MIIIESSTWRFITVFTKAHQKCFTIEISVKDPLFSLLGLQKKVFDV
jgi:hypothetical protein